MLDTPVEAFAKFGDRLGEAHAICSEHHPLKDLVGETRQFRPGDTAEFGNGNAGALRKLYEKAHGIREGAFVNWGDPQFNRKGEPGALTSAGCKL